MTPVTPYRARLYRLIFGAAAIYNVAFGIWAAIWPMSFFRLFELEQPRYPSIWACLGMVIGLYGAGYAYASLHLDRAKPFIAIGLAGKLLGPAGWVVAVSTGEWPVRTIALLVFNDLIWWVPFGLFLLDGTGAGARLRASAPYACVVVHLAALVAMAAALRFGTEIVPVTADRIRYISDHPMLWRAGWGLWIAAALSLIAFYAWWGSFLRHQRRAVVAVFAATIGLCCDLLAESLLIGWLPNDFDRVAPSTTILTGGAANGLYTVAGVMLTRATTSLHGPLRALAWTTWIVGGLLTVCSLAGWPMGIAISTTILFVCFCPFVLLLTHHLSAPSGRR